MKIQIDPEGYQPRKGGLLLLQCFVGFFFCLFVIRFWYLQIHKGDEYMRQSEGNRLRSELEYAARGSVLDVGGRLLAENRTAFGLELIREDCRDIPATLAQVSEWTDMPLERMAAKFQQDSQKAKPFEPILLLSDLPFDTVARMEARMLFWPGLRIVTHSKRTYPYGDIFAHILGYVAEANAKELEADPNLSLRDVVGKQGIEFVLDRKLRGRKGRYSVEVDVLGRSLGRDRIESPQIGETVRLNIDARLQQAIVDILGEQTGSVVVMEPGTGDIQALVTTPSYNNNMFIGGLAQRDWDALRDNPRHPLQNRAIQSVYPPGSVWKLMMAGMLL
ncbi:MAG: penicillin-binding protein 2, partial [Deltaproteobacteria bacterium]|nr:penicillin-binding protein 2 [Deltaproteobacteria bacterium]